PLHAADPQGTVLINGHRADEIAGKSGVGGCVIEPVCAVKTKKPANGGTNPEVVGSIHGQGTDVIVGQSGIVDIVNLPVRSRLPAQSVIGGHPKGIVVIDQEALYGVIG